MNHPKINTSKEPIRLFKSDFLEFFTHISPVAVTVIWLPVAVIFLVLAIRNRASFSSPALIAAGVIGGLFLWTLAEYLLHRFLFHFRPRNAWQERVSFLFHGVHHAQPMIKTRLVMPPVVSIPLALLFFGLFWLVLAVGLSSPQWVAPFFSGFIFGYLTYDLSHYSYHHFPIQWRAFRFLKRYHMFHHTKTPNARFGVSSPLWDLVFRTYVR